MPAGLLPEKFLDLADDFHKAIHLGLGVVKIKTRAGGGFHAELVHERLRAVMAASQRHSPLVGQLHHIMSVHLHVPCHITLMAPPGQVAHIGCVAQDKDSPCRQEPLPASLRTYRCWPRLSTAACVIERRRARFVPRTLLEINA